MKRLLTGTHRDFSALAGERPILDIGCADGATAFYLETHGFKVDVIDNPPTNINAMRGVHALKTALHSKVGIHSADPGGPAIAF